MINRTLLPGLTAVTAGMVLLGLTALVRPVMADTLTGTVSSQQEGAMEGVVVNAKKQGSTIMVSVVSNAEGRYSFPKARLSAGRYDVTIRAAGYKIPSTTVDIGAGKAATLDLKLDKITDKLELGRQLSSAEWMISLGEEGDRLGRCVNCHTLQLPMFSKHNAEAMAKVVQRMGRHPPNSTPMKPWFYTDAAEQLAKPPSQDNISLGAYIASINLSDREVWPFELKTLPRPKGEDTRVIYTTYTLPRPEAAPHDEELDADGNVWYSDFNSPYIGKLNPKTGEVREYKVPLRRPNGVAQGGLQIEIDPEGKVWYATMEQLQIVRLDPVTEKFDIFDLPVAVDEAGDAHTTMIDPSGIGLDGNLWFNVADGGPKGGQGAWRLHVASGKFTKITYPEGSPAAQAYDVIADSDNNLWGMFFTNPNFWRTDAKTLQTEWFPIPKDRKGCRRGHMDKQERIWCADYFGNGLIMFNTRTRQFEGNWSLPTAYTRPYDAEYDNKSYVWAGGVNDLIVRLDPKSGELNQFLLPKQTNIRNVAVQMNGPNDLSSFWVGDQQGATITHIEPLTP